MKIKLTLLSFVLILLFSCQKEYSQDTTTVVVTNPVSGDSIYLSQYIIIDTAQLIPDTAIKIHFYYDAAKRNTGIDYIEYEANVPTRIFKSQFDYQGSDTFPVKKILRTYNLPSLTIDSTGTGLNQTTYFFYKNAQLSSDSSIYELAPNAYQVVDRYSYYADSIVNNLTEYYGTPLSGENLTEKIYVKRINGNIVQQDDTSLYATENFTFLYDTHPNPFCRTQSKFMIENRFPFYWMETWVEDIFATNNALEINENYNSNSRPDYNFHFKNVYLYQANGYPSILWATDQNNPDESFKAFYLYTN